MEFIGRYSKKNYDYDNLWFKMPLIFDKRNLRGLEIIKKMIKFLYGEAYN